MVCSTDAQNVLPIEHQRQLCSRADDMMTNLCCMFAAFSIHQSLTRLVSAKHVPSKTFPAFCVVQLSNLISVAFCILALLRLLSVLCAVAAVFYENRAASLSTRPVSLQSHVGFIRRALKKAA